MSTQAQGKGGVFSGGTQGQFNTQMKRIYVWYTGGFLVFLVAQAIAEQSGLPRRWIGYTFLFATVGL